MLDEGVRNLLIQDGRLTLPAAVGLFCVAGALLLAVFALLAGSGKTAGRGKTAGGGKAAGGRSARPLQASGQGRGRRWQRLYLWMANAWPTRRVLRIVRNRLELSSGYDERGLRRQAAMILLFTGVLMLALMTVFALLSRDVLLCVIFAGMLGFLADAVLDITVTRVGNRLLVQQIRFHEQLRHRYYEEHAVDGALERACEAMRDDKAHEMYAQGEKLLDMLGAPDTEAAFEHYRQTAPNRYLKLLAGLCVMTREYGDAQHEGGSVFLRGLGHLSEEIRAELFKREKLTYALRSLGALSLAPLFFLRPIRGWAGNSFAPMAKFYAQGSGTVLELLMIAISLACHAGIRALQHQGEARPVARRTKRWEDLLLGSFLRPLLWRLVPPRYSVRHQQQDRLLKRAVSALRVQDLTCRKLVAAVGAFLLVLALSLFLQVQQTHRILHEPDVPEGFLGGRLSEPDMAIMREQTAFDREILLSVPINISREALATVVAEAGVPPAEQAAATDRIWAKQAQLRGQRFWWWELALCFLAMAAGWRLPELYLGYQARVRALDMEDEVSRFQTMILMLMHMPRMDVEELLQWMEMFSQQFRESLQTCLSDFSAGAVEALGVLRDAVPFEPMAALVGDLMLAASNLPVAKAFEALDSEKQWTRDRKRMLNEQLVERKRNLGHVVGFLPLYALIGLYLMLPMVVASMSEMQRFYQQMSAF